MGEKIKLSIIADAGAPTGFATVTHNVADYLQNTGDFDINILGINYHGKPNEWSKKFKIYPAFLGGDYLGIGYTAEFIHETSPDVIFLFQDFWNIAFYISQIGTRPGMVAYYPVDSPNIKGKYIMCMSTCAEICTYTNFGVQESVRATKEAWAQVLLAAKGNKINVAKDISIEVAGGLDPASNKQIGGGQIRVPIQSLKRMMAASTYNVIPHGVDTSKFYPIDKKDAREKFNLPIDAFVIGNVNRNQSRKRQDLSIKAFSQFAKGKENVFLILHSVRDDSKGWDLEQLAIYYGVPDQVLMTHKLFPEKSATTEQLNWLYNCFDVHMNTGGGEGWGLNSHEAAACKIPQIVPDWSATKEIWENAAELIPVIEVRHEPSQINTAQAVISVPALVEILNKFYEDKTHIDKVGELCYNVSQRSEYRWENVGKQFAEVFKRAYGKLPPSGPVALSSQGLLELKKLKQGK